MFLVSEVGRRVQLRVTESVLATVYCQLSLMPLHLSGCLCVHCISAFVTECVPRLLDTIGNIIG